jgi:hypothetical protein
LKLGTRKPEEEEEKNPPKCNEISTPIKFKTSRRGIA